MSSICRLALLLSQYSGDVPGICRYQLHDADNNNNNNNRSARAIAIVRINAALLVSSAGDYNSLDKKFCRK
jgi:hypothetical protein